MAEYALLIDDVFKEIRQYDVKPPDIPHKNITWYEVVREYSENPTTGIKDGKWVIQLLDYSNLPPEVPNVVSPRQVRIILHRKNLLANVEAMIATQDEEIQIAWNHALEFRRDDPLLNQLSLNLNLTQEQLDQFFIEAGGI